MFFINRAEAQRNGWSGAFRTPQITYWLTEETHKNGEVHALNSLRVEDPNIRKNGIHMKKIDVTFSFTTSKNGRFSTQVQVGWWSNSNNRDLMLIANLDKSHSARPLFLLKSSNQQSLLNFQYSSGWSAHQTYHVMCSSIFSNLISWWNFSSTHPIQKRKNYCPPGQERKGTALEKGSRSLSSHILSFAWCSCCCCCCCCCCCSDLRATLQSWHQQSHLERGHRLSYLVLIASMDNRVLKHDLLWTSAQSIVNLPLKIVQSPCLFGSLRIFFLPWIIGITLPPIIMEVENGSLQYSFPSFRVIFHFHDYGRKGTKPPIDRFFF